MGIDITFKSNIPELKKKIEDTAFDKMIKAVNEVRNKTLVTLSGNRRGEIYTVMAGSVSKSKAQEVRSGKSYQIKPSDITVGGKRRRVYTASAAGEAPAVLTGQLRQSVAGTVKIEGKQVVGRVGTELKKGPELEFGTRNMAARPWLRKSFEESEAKVKEIFMRIWF